MLCLQPDSRLILAKLVTKYPADVDSAILLKILKAHWKGGKQGNVFRMDGVTLWGGGLVWLMTCLGGY